MLASPAAAELIGEMAVIKADNIPASVRNQCHQHGDIKMAMMMTYAPVKRRR